MFEIKQILSTSNESLNVITEGIEAIMSVSTSSMETFTVRPVTKTV